MASGEPAPGARDRAALTARNAAMYTRYQAGEKVVDLAHEFGISRARVLEVIRRAQSRRQAEVRARTRPDLINATQVGHRAMRALTAAKITRWDQLADATADSLLRLPRIGPALAATIITARDGLTGVGEATHSTA
jgi:DNA uptake protein ComE-like DNA-binding protein